jgi:hypothetical protein
MLRWTCRLRDALEQQGFLTERDSVRYLTQMREAELISPEGTFPDAFRWETLAACYNTTWVADRPGRDKWMVYLWSRNVEFPSDCEERSHCVPAVDPNNATCQAIRELSGQAVTDQTQNKIDILWLSPDVFVSQACFRIIPEWGWWHYPHDYQLIFSSRSPETRRTQFCVFSLLSFSREEPGEPSSLPIYFAQHMTASMNLSSFSKVSLLMNPHSTRSLPEDSWVRFLSVAPNRILPPSID